MPNLRVASSTNNEQQQRMAMKEMKEAGKGESDVFVSQQQQQQRPSPSTSTTTKKPAMVSIGVSTTDLDHNMNHKFLDLHQMATLSPQTAPPPPKKPETVVIQKRSFNCTGIDFGIGGVFVKDFDRKDISFKKGELSVGKNIILYFDFVILETEQKFLIFVRKYTIKREFIDFHGKGKSLKQ